MFDTNATSFHLPCVAALALSFCDPTDCSYHVCSLLRANGASHEDMIDTLAWLSSIGCYHGDANLLAIPESFENGYTEVTCTSMRQELRVFQACASCPRTSGMWTNKNEEKEHTLLAYLLCEARENRWETLNQITEEAALSLFSSAFITVGTQGQTAYPVHYLVYLLLTHYAKSKTSFEVAGVDALLNAVSRLGTLSLSVYGKVAVGDVMKDEAIRTIAVRLYEDMIDCRYNVAEVGSYLKDAGISFSPSSQQGLNTDTTLADFLSTDMEAIYSGSALDVEDIAVRAEPEVSTEPDCGMMDAANPAGNLVTAEQAAKPVAIATADAVPPPEDSTEAPSLAALLPEEVHASNEANDAASDSLNQLHTEERAIDRQIELNGLKITPLSSVGDAYENCYLGPDGLVNPYIAYGSAILELHDLTLTPFKLAFYFESVKNVYMEYAICDNKEGVLVYLYDYKECVFLPYDATDYLTVLINQARKNHPRKVSLLSAPLLDFFLRMGVETPKGFLSLYDLYRIVYEVPEGRYLSPLALFDQSPSIRVVSAIKRYPAILRNLEMKSFTRTQAAQLQASSNINRLFAASVYSYDINGNRSRHLSHDGIAYVLDYRTNRDLRGRVGTAKVILQIADDTLDDTKKEACYRTFLAKLGSSGNNRKHHIRVLEYDSRYGVTYVVPVPTYQWAHTNLFLWLTNITMEYTGKRRCINEVSCQY